MVDAVVGWLDGGSQRLAGVDDIVNHPAGPCAAKNEVTPGPKPACQRRSRPPRSSPATSAEGSADCCGGVQGRSRWSPRTKANRLEVPSSLAVGHTSEVVVEALMRGTRDTRGYGRDDDESGAAPDRATIIGIWAGVARWRRTESRSRVTDVGDLSSQRCQRVDHLIRCVDLACLRRRWVAAILRMTAGVDAEVCPHEHRGADVGGREARAADRYRRALLSPTTSPPRPGRESRLSGRCLKYVSTGSDAPPNQAARRRCAPNHCWPARRKVLLSTRRR